MEAIGLLSFHDLHNMGLYYELALASNLLCLCRLLLSRLRSLLLHYFLWNKVASDRIRGKGWVDLDLLVLSKDGLLWVLLKK